ncbi:MAG: septum formation initiator [Campylobacteraceae bacterium]|jgi:hypothetical protein|nr:septum formation initiator [Campylobacteraceae bacterium]
MKTVERLKNIFFSNIDQKRFYSYAKRVLVSFGVIILGIYFGNMLFGSASLEVLLDLKNGKAELEQRIHDLKNVNAKLQKELFEKQQLDPDIRQ